METLYRCLYWRLNEYQLIAADYPSLPAIGQEIARVQRAMDWLVSRLGFTPEG